MSIRARLLLITMALLVVGIVVSDAVVTAALHRRLIERVDRQLAPIAQVLVRLDPAVARQASAGPIRNLDLINDLAIAYLRSDGTVEATIASTPAPRFDAALLRAEPGVPFTVEGTGGSDWRMVVLPRPGGGVVAVAASLAATDEIMTRIRLICLVTGVVLVVVLTAAGWLAIRAGLRPLRSIERTAAAIAAGDLAHRVPDAGRSGTEIAQLTAALNGMLAQIERAFAERAESEARMRRFVADVSHELRTPLFGIKGSAELQLMGGATSPEDVTRTMRRIDAEAGRLAALVEDLLLLARLDEPAAGPVVDRAPMDLRSLAADARGDLLALDPARPVTLTGPGDPDSLPGPAPILGDEARLRQVVVNLVGNVQAYTPAGSPVRIGVGRLAGEAVLEIADSGPGLTEEQAGRVFERFYRAEGSRSRGSGSGAGLGLSIVWSLVGAHGGRVEVLSGPGATFRLSFPLLEDSQKS
jgi:two-component system OmpR family sensor kinase